MARAPTVMYATSEVGSFDARSCSTDPSVTRRLECVKAQLKEHRRLIDATKADELFEIDRTANKAKHRFDDVLDLAWFELEPACTEAGSNSTWNGIQECSRLAPWTQGMGVASLREIRQYVSQVHRPNYFVSQLHRPKYSAPHP